MYLLCLLEKLQIKKKNAPTVVAYNYINKFYVLFIFYSTLIWHFAILFATFLKSTLKAEPIKI